MILYVFQWLVVVSYSAAQTACRVRNRYLPLSSSTLRSLRFDRKLCVWNRIYFKSNQGTSKFHFSKDFVSRLAAHTCQCLSQLSQYEATRSLNWVPFSLSWTTAFYLAYNLGLQGDRIIFLNFIYWRHSLFFSDGVGRSGCVATIMSVIERVKIEQTVDVFQTIKLIRAKRPGAVNTLVSC